MEENCEGEYLPSIDPNNTKCLKDFQEFEKVGNRKHTIFFFFFVTLLIIFLLLPYYVKFDILNDNFYLQCISGLDPGHVLEPVCEIASSNPHDIVREKRSLNPNQVPYAHGMAFISDHDLYKVSNCLLKIINLQK